MGCHGARGPGAGRLRQRAPGRERARGRVRARGRRRVVPGPPEHRPALHDADRGPQHRRPRPAQPRGDDRHRGAGRRRPADAFATQPPMRGWPIPTSPCGSSTAGRRAATPPPATPGRSARSSPARRARSVWRLTAVRPGNYKVNYTRVARPARQGRPRRRPAHHRVVPRADLGRAGARARERQGRGRARRGRRAADAGDWSSVDEADVRFAGRSAQEVGRRRRTAPRRRSP